MENKIVYINKPTGARENSINTVNDMQSFVNMEEIKEDVPRPKNATFENDQWLLDGTFEAFPDNPVGLGYISEIISNENGYFEKDIVLTRTYDNSYTSPRDIDSFWHKH